MSGWDSNQTQPRKSPPTQKKGGPAGGGGRGLVGGWCPPPGPGKSRRSVWRGPQGPTGHGDENKNRAQTALLAPPRRRAPPRDPPPAPSAIPATRHPPAWLPTPDAPLQPILRPFLERFPRPKLAPFRPSPSEVQGSTSPAQGGAKKRRTCPSVVFSPNRGDGTFRKRGFLDVFGTR